jgi:hypothetical protein
MLAEGTQHVDGQGGHLHAIAHARVQSSFKSGESSATSVSKRPSGLVDRVRSEVLSHEEDLEQNETDEMPIEFGKMTTSISLSTYDGIPTVTSSENKSVELAPTARGGVGMPEIARAQWTFRLDQAKGLISIGVMGLSVPVGMPFRKAELRDKVWYYTSDGVLRNGARTVGRKGSEATTGDVVTMRLARNRLQFLINDVPFPDSIDKLEGAPLFVCIQIHRKGDAVSLTGERFDQATLDYLKNLSWGSVSVIAEGPLVDHDAVKLSGQRTVATCCYTAPDVFGSIVSSARGASFVRDGMSARWKVSIDSYRSSIYIGVEQVTWQHGLDWWNENAVERVWYYASNGSLRTGNSILQRSVVTYEEEPTITLGQQGSKVKREVAIYTPYIPELQIGDVLTVTLENRTLSFHVNGTAVEGEIHGVRGTVRLAAQFEEDGDSISILPFS